MRKKNSITGFEEEEDMILNLTSKKICFSTYYLYSSISPLSQYSQIF
jgi:hypothetical protein